MAKRSKAKPRQNPRRGAHNADARSPGMIERGPGAVAKFSEPTREFPHGEFLGFYRIEQQTGRPTAETPLAREINELERRYRAELGRIKFEDGKREANAASLLVRGQTAQRVYELDDELDREGVSSRDRTRRIVKRMEKEGKPTTARCVQQIRKRKRNLQAP
jgi:hypothetical protein